MILGQTTSTNKQLYAPTCVFVKTVGSNVKVFAGASGSDITSALQVTMKKESAPTLDKKSKNPDHSGEAWSSLITSNAGKNVEFRVKIDIPAFSDGTSFKLTLKDTIKNIQYLSDSIKVYSDEACTKEISGAIATNGLTVGTYNTTSHTQAISVLFDFDTIHPTATTSSTIYVYYKATLTQDAIVNNSDASNSAKLEYSNEATPGNSSETGSSDTDVDLFEFKLSKVDQDNAALSGASFSFYTTATSKTPITFSSGDSGYYPDANGTVTEIPATNGSLHIVGLDAGSYYIEETTTPAGYYAPSGRFLLKLESSQKNVLSSTSAFTAVDTADSGLISSSGVVTDNTSAFQVTLINSSTPVLPTAGGAGTLMFTLVGIALMVLAGGMIVVCKKKAANK
jgi:LPXTG-motif cell wall-anchored protein